MKFDQLIESYIIKNTTRMFYPKNLKFSKEFLEAFKKEYHNQKKVIAEGKGKNKSFKLHLERMLKGLRFEAKKIEDGVKEEGRTIGATPAAGRMKAAVNRARGGMKKVVPRVRVQNRKWFDAPGAKPKQIRSKEQLENALWEGEITDEEAERDYPGWYDRLKSDALNDLADEA